MNNCCRIRSQEECLTTHGGSLDVHVLKEVLLLYVGTAPQAAHANIFLLLPLSQSPVVLA